MTFFFFDYAVNYQYLARFIEQYEKARRIINSPFCRRCPEEDSGRTREVIAIKYVRRGEPVEFLSLTILVLDDWSRRAKN